MRLPDAVRVDLLEFLGGTPIANIQLQKMIETVSTQIEPDRSKRIEAN
jgi:hypothetical protein